MATRTHPDEIADLEPVARRLWARAQRESATEQTTIRESLGVDPTPSTPTGDLGRDMLSRDWEHLPSPIQQLVYKLVGSVVDALEDEGFLVVKPGPVVS